MAIPSKGRKISRVDTIDIQTHRHRQTDTKIGLIVTNIVEKTLKIFICPISKYFLSLFFFLLEIFVFQKVRSPKEDKIWKFYVTKVQKR